MNATKTLCQKACVKTLASKRLVSKHFTQNTMQCANTIAPIVVPLWPLSKNRMHRDKDKDATEKRKLARPLYKFKYTLGGMFDNMRMACTCVFGHPGIPVRLWDVA
jgi:hypothetical protein